MYMLDDHFFERTKYAHMQYWDEKLFDFSMPTVMFPLNVDECRSIIQAFNQGLRWNVALRGLAKRIEDVGARFENGFFVKLDSRSPKDSPLWESKQGLCTSGVEAVELLCDCPRINEDLTIAPMNHTVYLVVRQFVPMQIWQEFRCFISQGKLVGISQNHPRQQFETVVENRDEIKASIVRLVDSVLPYLQSQDIVLDTYVEQHPDGWRATLIETNPYVRECSPCLFEWMDEFTLDVRGQLPEFRIVDDLDALLEKDRLKEARVRNEIQHFVKSAALHTIDKDVFKLESVSSTDVRRVIQRLRFRPEIAGGSVIVQAEDLRRLLDWAGSAVDLLERTQNLDV